MDKTTLESLTRHDHKVGTTGMTNDGMVTVAIDDRMLTFPEIDKLLEDDLQKERT
jgi:hypothetical protein